jgi:hypothetical protein
VKINLTAATIAKLELGPDDTVVFRVTEEHRKLTADQASQLVKQAKNILGEDTKVIVLPYGLEIEVLEEVV